MIYLTLLIAQIGVLLLMSRSVHNSIGRLFYRITKSKKLTVYLSAILFLPGTFVHEMSHFLAAMFLLVPVGEVELLPKIEDNSAVALKKGISVTLGSVKIAKTDPIRRFLIGVAPLIFGFVVLIIVIQFAYLGFTNNTNTYLKGSFMDEILLGYFVFTVANNMFSSKRDMEGSWILVVLIFVIILIFWLLGLNINIDYSWVRGIIELPIWRILVIFMTIPVIFDIIVITGLRRI